MKTLLAVALLLGASESVAHAEWEILESPNLTPGLTAEVREPASNPADTTRITRALERAGYTDVKVQRLPSWSGTATKNGSKVLLQIDDFGQVIEQK